MSVFTAISRICACSDSTSWPASAMNFQKALSDHFEPSPSEAASVLCAKLSERLFTL